MKLCSGISFHDVGHLVQLVHHGRTNEVEQDAEQEERFEESDEYRHETPFEVEQAAVVLHEWFKHVGQKACHEEWQQHVFEGVDKPYGSGEKHHGEYDAYHAVESIFFSGCHRSVGV